MYASIYYGHADTARALLAKGAATHLRDKVRIVDKICILNHHPHVYTDFVLLCRVETLLFGLLLIVITQRL